MLDLYSSVLQLALDPGIVTQALLVVATGVLAVSTFFLYKSSKAHEKLVHTQTLVLIKPHIAIRRISRLHDSKGELLILNAGMGSASNVRAIVSWPGTSHQVPQNPDGFLVLAVGDERTLKFSLSENTEYVDVKVLYTDELGTSYEGNRTSVRVRKDPRLSGR